jgi:hypothetical protein
MPYEREVFRFDGLSSKENDFASIMNFGGGALFDQYGNYISANAKNWSKIGRFDVLNKVDFLDDSARIMGNVYSTEYLKSLKAYSGAIKTYGGGFANIAGYVGAADKFYKGDNIGGSIDATSNSISIAIGRRNPIAGAAWSFGWFIGESLSQTELYNRILFGTNSATYYERKHYWSKSKILNDE